MILRSFRSPSIPWIFFGLCVCGKGEGQSQDHTSVSMFCYFNARVRGECVMRSFCWGGRGRSLLTKKRLHPDNFFDPLLPLPPGWMGIVPAPPRGFQTSYIPIPSLSCGSPLPLSSLPIRRRATMSKYVAPRAVSFPMVPHTRILGFGVTGETAEEKFLLTPPHNRTHGVLLGVGSAALLNADPRIGGGGCRCEETRGP